jgi:CheY-like chemotaxis protein
MIQPLLRYGIGVVFLVVVLAQAPAQVAKDQPAKDKEAPPPKPAKSDPFDQYRELFKKPETVADYWKAMEFEIDLGSYEVAATHLHGLLQKKPTDEELLDLQKHYTMNAFLRLRNIPKWSDDPKVEKQARADVEELIKLVTAAVKNRLNNREQIVKWIKNLNASPEEATYALQQLYTYKSAAAPLLIDELRKTEGGDRLALIDALRRLSSAVVPPMIAALDSDDQALVLDLLDVLQKRKATEAIPFLWYLTEDPNRQERVRKKAKEVLAYLRDEPLSRLPGAVPMLVRQADLYYQHKVAMTEPVTVWRWDGNMVVAGWPGAETVSKSKAEEYYGTRFAKQALGLDPTDKDTQIIMLSLTLDKAYEGAGLDKSLEKAAPEVHDLLTTVSPELLTAVLERSLKDQRTGVVLGAVQALGDVAEARANKPTGRGEPPLVRALDYADRRVQMAAVESLLRIPGAPSAGARGRMVEILARFLSAEPAEVNKDNRPKALAASSDADTRLRLEGSIKAAGFDAVLAESGRDALKRLGKAADISAVLLDSKLPDPGLPYFVAQVEADPNTKKLPVLILAIPDNAETRDLLERYNKEKARLDFIISQTADIRRAREATEREYLAARRAFLDNPVSSAQEQAERLARLEESYQSKLKELVRRWPQQAILDKEAQQIEPKLRDLSAKYDDEAVRRQRVLTRWAEPYTNVQVISQKYLDDTRQLQARLSGENQPDLKPLSGAELKDYAEKAIRDLAAMVKADAGYDVRPAEKAVYAALRASTLSPGGQLAALDVAGKYSGATAQTELATVVADAKRPMLVRIRAADELIRHVQEDSPLLNRDQAQALKALADQSATQADLKDLRPHLMAVIGSLRPDAKTTGDRLRDFPIPPPTPPKEKPPADKPPDDKPLPPKDK